MSATTPGIQIHTLTEEQFGAHCVDIAELYAANISRDRTRTDVLLNEIYDMSHVAAITPEGVIAGAVSYRHDVYWPAMFEKYTGIHYIATASQPEFRRRGIGTLLVARVVSAALARGNDSVQAVAVTPASNGLFRSMGFQGGPDWRADQDQMRVIVGQSQ